MQELVIEAGRSEPHYWRTCGATVSLQVLVWRDFRVIGIAWALIRPFLTMVVVTVIFGRLAKLPSDGSAAYALMVFAGMLPCRFFERLERCSNSLLSNEHLVGLPRLIAPTAAATSALSQRV